MSKMKIRNLLPLIVLFVLSGCSVDKQKSPVNQKVGIQPDGSILVPSNQLLRPAGFQVTIPGRPVDLALTPDGKFLLVKNKGDLDLIRLSDRTVMQSLPFSQSGASFTGICISPDGQKIYVTDAKDRICIAELDDNIMQWIKPVVLPSPSVGGSPLPGGLVLSEKGDKLFVTLSRSNSLAVIDLSDNSVSEIPVGIAPFSVICSSQSKAYVSNWGGRRPMDGEPTYNSSGSQVLIDPKTGIANNGSVSVVDLNGNVQIKNIEVGLHPCDMVLSPDRQKLYVACANSDIISVISTVSDEVTENISVHREGDILFGSSPNDLTVSPDGKYLYVANGTDNAICVIQTEPAAKVVGYIPTG